MNIRPFIASLVVRTEPESRLIQRPLRILAGILLATQLQAQDGIVRFRQGTLTVSEGVGIAVVELERTSTTAGAQVTVQSAAQTAVPGVDFHSIQEIYVFAPNETLVSLAIQIFDNTLMQSDRQFQLTLSNPVNLVPGSPATAQITIADNDDALSPGRGAAGTNLFQGVYAIGTNSSNALIVGGSFRTYNGAQRPQLTRLLPSGELDPAFDAGSGPDGQVWAVVVQPDERVLVGGAFTHIAGLPRSRIARLESTGGIDSTFNPGAGADALVESIELQANGQILIAGPFGSYNGTPRTDVALLNADGSLDNTFNAVTPTSFFGDVARRHGDHILVGGAVAGPGANVQNSLMRFNLAGVRDSSFQVSVGDIFFNQVFDLVVQPDSRIVIAGSFLGVNGVPSSGVARLNANGTIDPGFSVGSGADDTVIRIKLLEDGRFLVSGVFLRFNGQPRSGIARLNANGSLDLTFNPGAGANDYVYNTLPLADGGALVAGAFSQFDGYDRFRLAELNSNGSLKTQPLRFVETSPAPGANLQLRLAVEPGRDFRLLTSSTLGGWSPVSTNRTARRTFEMPRPAAEPREFFQIEQAFEAP